MRHSPRADRLYIRAAHARGGTMPADPLAIYVNDHLAGSIAGLNLMDAL